jgi:hypothetical protein
LANPGRRSADPAQSSVRYAMARTLRDTSEAKKWNYLRRATTYGHVVEIGIPQDAKNRLVREGRYARKIGGNLPMVHRGCTLG